MKMAVFETLFPTSLYRANFRPMAGIEKTCLSIAAEDKAGQRWSRTHGYGGYTSYASLDDLTRRASIFADLEKTLDGHVAGFARGLRFEKKRLKLDSIWINVMEKGAVHTPHIHPHSAVSGTYYVTAPPRSGAIRFEDPRLGLMMAAPTRKAGHFVDVTPKPGLFLLWESWLRHGVEPNRAKGRRISISFNYA